MRIALICSAESVFNRRVLPAFLASFAELVGIVVIHNTRGMRWRRLKYEWRRSRLRLLDVIAFRLFYRVRLAAGDSDWIRRRAEAELNRFSEPPSVPVLETAEPNSPETRAFLESLRPDLALAACKSMLKPEIFNVPPHGTFVVHPGICPEYRNSHGCFWALARRDLDHVGATLLQIDEGSDTGPVYAYYYANIDERSESHVVIQARVVYDNLERIRDDLQAIVGGHKGPIDISGRPSAAWGQPRMTDYLRWKNAAREAV